MELSTLFLPKNKYEPEVEPENKNTSACKLYQNITYATSKLYRVTTKVKKKKKRLAKANIQLKALTFQKKLIYNIQDTAQEIFSIIQQQWKSIHRTKLNVDRMSVAPSISTWAL